jgi:MinD-like ATPase involved in chromosome partitioning or flagellar assembly
MSLIAVGSVRGAPGATTLAVALAAVWDRAGHAPFLVEADPDGGVLAARFGLGHHPSLTELGVRARSNLDLDDVWASAQALPAPRSGDGVPVVVAHPSADQCQATLRSVGGRLGGLLDSLATHDVIVDVGRLRPGSPALALVEAATVVLVVLRPRLEDIDAVGQRITALNEGGHARLVVVGERPYPATDVAAALGVGVIGVIADDARSAAALAGDGGSANGLGRLPLLRSARALAHELAARLDQLGAPLPPPVRA